MVSVSGYLIGSQESGKMLFARGSKGDLNVRGAFLHMASDAVVSAGVVVLHIRKEIGGHVANRLQAGFTWKEPI